MTPALDRLGALTTTGVGSLPFAAPGRRRPARRSRV